MVICDNGDQLVMVCIVSKSFLEPKSLYILFIDVLVQLEECIGKSVHFRWGHFSHHMVTVTGKIP